MNRELLDVVEFAEPESPGSTQVTPRPPVRTRELAALLIIVVLADLTIYRGEGFAGMGVFFAGAAGALLFGVWRSRIAVTLEWTLPLLALLAVKLAWNGTELAVVLGAMLLVATAMGLAGQRPFVLEGLLFAAQAIPAGLLALGRYAAGFRPSSRWGTTRNLVAILLPTGVLALFSALFVLANPDLLSWISRGWADGIRSFRKWIVSYGPSPVEAAFWFAVAWLAAGLLRPLIVPSTEESSEAQGTAEPATGLQPAPLYAAFRNTLASVVALFALYLAFEFSTLWFRELPEGFYYSGYAHEGAAWLTVALALATLTLSIVFQGRTLRDTRLATLRKWAGAWAIENLVLALAVYHRMLIYIDFNGMTRMRVVGLLGISAVAAGLMLVLVKIARSRSFLWLVRRDLWVLAFCVYLYALLPVDMLVTWYNVRRILAGDPAPSVQISVHPLRSEGLLQLSPLLTSDDPLIREGVRAMLAEKLSDFDSSRSARNKTSWTAWQLADERLEQQLQALDDNLAPYQSAGPRTSARRAFDQYAYQWY